MFLTGLSWSVAGRGLVLGAGLVSTAVLARVLDPDSLGAFLLLSSLTSVLAVAAGLGLQDSVAPVIAREVALGRPGVAAAVAHRAVRVAVLGGIALSAALAVPGMRGLVSRLFGSEQLGGVWPWAMALVLVAGLELVLAGVFRGYNEMRDATLFGCVVRSALFPAALGLLALAGVRSLTAAVAAVAGAGALAVVVGLGVAASRRRGVAERNGVLGRDLRRSSAAMLGVASVNMVVAQGALWTVGVLGTTRDVALYGSALRVVALVSLPLVVTNLVLPPLIARLHAQRRAEDLETLLRGAASMALAVSAAAVAVLAVGGQKVLDLLYGGYYGQAYGLLLVLAAGQVVNVASGPCATTLMMTGKARLVLVVSAVSCALMVGSAVVAFPFAGRNGVALAAAGALVFQNAVLWVLTKRHIGVRTDASPRRTVALVRSGVAW